MKKLLFIPLLLIATYCFADVTGGGVTTSNVIIQETDESPKGKLKILEFPNSAISSYTSVGKAIIDFITPLVSTYLKLDCSNDPLTNTLNGANALFTGTLGAGAITGSAGATFVGDVGIGTTDIESWSSSYRAIESYGSSIMFSLANDLLSIQSNAYYDGAWKYKSTNEVIQYYLLDGTFSLKTALSGTVDTVITWINALTVVNSGNVGIGTTAPYSKLEVAGAIATAVATKTADYTLLISNSIILSDATSASIVFTLPTAVGITGRQYIIKKIDSSANTVTIDGNGSETIDGELTQIISDQYVSMTIVSDGANWLII